MGHVVLLGDSIFDNAAYVGGDPDVALQLKEQLPAGWQVTLRALDGAVVSDVPLQLERLPRDATHLVLSAGGNDALSHVEILSEPARSTAEVLSRLADYAAAFESRYRAVLAAVRDRELPTALCTIYYPSFPDPVIQRLAVTALTVFNDAILRQAFTAGVPVLDLRLICDSPADYANPIEPSAQGGAKIARAIVQTVTLHDFRRRRTEVFQ
jgi:lysophospholipase L1-like esterase